jgi:hypothetical protein
MKKLTHSLFALLLLASIAVPYGLAGENEHDENHICFTRVDDNVDDKVTPEELRKFYPKDKALFEKIDQDKDGSISHEEYEEYWYSQE